ncbi:TolC family protein [Bacteroidota bacterium]
MQTKKLLIGIFMIILSGSIFAQQGGWTLEDCINYALENNIRIKQSELTTESFKTDLLQKKLDLLPSVNGTAQGSWSAGRTPDPQTNLYTTESTKNMYFGLNAGITIFNGLQKFNAIKKAIIDFQASQYDSDKMRDDISLLIASAYLQILFSKELVKTATDQVEITTQQINRTNKLVEAGTLAKGDLLDMQSQGAQEEVNLINAENQLTIAYLDLSQILDLAASEAFEVDIPGIDIKQTPTVYSVDQVYSYALINLPEIKSAELRLESAMRTLSIARGSRSPSLNAGGSWTTNWSDRIRDNFLIPNSPTMSFGDQVRNNENKGLSLTLSVPIFNGFQVSNYISQSRINVDYANYDLELSRDNVRKTVEQAYADASASYKTYMANEKSLESFREAFKYMEQKFNVGLVNSLDYNTAKTQLTRAESNLLSAKYDFVFKTKVLDFYMGKPISLDDFIVK